ncbi:MAG: transcription repressor NadR [Defluviitaleaceae bacterium]|nr:transcription repressor NadR [Defluviitaleaceae bacterium]MCL2274741.1 transcription repressor NadR [Defluviitaleaceae bacterium]
MINESNMPVSASALAKELNVSRQVIVGDVAILRAQGYEIIATARGYIVPALRDLNQHVGKIACCHNAENTINELYIIVDLGATVVNVIVEHELYGEITGPLNIKTRDDVDIFIDRVKSLEVKLLSVLTHGVHLHTIACCNKSHFEQVCHALNNAGYLVKN